MTDGQFTVSDVKQRQIDEWLFGQMPFELDKITIPLMRQFDLNSREALEAIKNWQDTIW